MPLQDAEDGRCIRVRVEGELPVSPMEMVRVACIFTILENHRPTGSMGPPQSPHLGHVALSLWFLFCEVLKSSWLGCSWR